MIANVEADHLQKQREMLLDEVRPDSEPGKAVARLRQLEAEMSELRSALSGDGGNALAPGDAAKTTEETSSADSEGVLEDLRRLERAQQRLLNRLENEHFGLFQLLKLDPRELRAFHEELEDGQAVVQYLPTPKKLFIHLVTRDGKEIREVAVAEEELYGRASQVAAQLATHAYRMAGIEPRGIAGSLAEAVLPDLHAELLWLYDKLLRPVERDLSEMEHVFVAPIGALTYVPFPALIRSISGHTVEYAAERIAMGVLPSLFHLQLVLRHRESYLDDSLILGDPDGSLEGAREEVKEVADQLATTIAPLVGREATVDRFLELAPESRIVHLATHGVLNHERPQESYLLLADGERLRVTDIAVLELEETDLVVLSACETGIGRDGLEYATLARAFAHARVPTVVASLWAVNDPATRQLMSLFYRNFVDSGDVFKAMAGAQRAMIGGDDAWSHPAAWSGFVVFGKP